jgi:SAM-dependent methyltransferase
MTSTDRLRAASAVGLLAEVGRFAARQQARPVVDPWLRRTRNLWLADLVVTESRRRSVTRVLDVACGGTGYLGDAHLRLGREHDLTITLVGRDRAELAYAAEVELPPAARPETICAPIPALAGVLRARTFDVVIAAGLVDRLDRASAVALLEVLAAATAPGGIVALTHPLCDGGSRVFRTEEEVARLFDGTDMRVRTTLSANGSSVLAAARRPYPPLPPGWYFPLLPVPRRR